MFVDLKKLGACCRDFRKDLGVSQEIVGQEIGYTNQSISWFELGRNDSFTILAWYFYNGLKFEDLKKSGVFKE